MTQPTARVLSGDRPTGALHLGHYFGTLQNRVRLQEAGHDLIVLVADYQVITDRDRPGDLARTVADLVLDYLACGLDPGRVTIFAHSAVPALNQLLLPFLSLVTHGELTRNPTVKEEIRAAGRPTVSGLMLTYPVHQAADILFCQAELVPVGRDQLPHLEVTRSIARRFNERYGETFVVPSALLSEAPLVSGLDGRKMGKSAGNSITLRATPDEVAAAVRAARTDSERQITFDPQRRPEVATLLTLAALCTGRPPEALAAEIGDGGAIALKSLLTQAIVQVLAPMRARRARLAATDVSLVLRDGAARASELAEGTLDRVRQAMGMDYVGTSAKVNM